MTLLRFGRFRFGNCRDLERNGRIVMDTDQNLRKAEFLLIGLDLLRRQRAEGILSQAAEDAALAVFHAAIEGQVQKNALVVCDQRDPIFIGIDRGDETADNFLHFLQTVNLFLIGDRVGFHDQNIQ